MTKRMNWRQGNSEVELTSWENILATKQEVSEPIQGEMAVVGIDYTKINDFASAGILTKRGCKIRLEAENVGVQEQCRSFKNKIPAGRARRNGRT